MSKTIIDAAIEASIIIGKAALIDELYNVIIMRNLYEFGAKDPKSVLRLTLDRHCVNKSLGVMHQNRFYKKFIDGRYELISKTLIFDGVINKTLAQYKADEVDSSSRSIYSLASIQRDKVKKKL